MARRPVAVFLALGVLLASALIGGSPVRGQAAGVTYVYDALGRLVAVVAPSGDAAACTYDAVGNLLAITRHPAGAVRVFEFTPDAGPVGTAVMIYGMGFSATPSQNTVTFNGTAATVSASTATSIATAVPAGATTGLIAVTSPSGSATSAEVFTVGPAGAPTITDFTPLIGTAGTAVTITGSNFDPVVANNRATLIDGVVPALTGSGKIAVTTMGGQATSAADFYVPPAPYTAADVVFSSRFTFAQSVGVAVPAANRIGLAIFDASQGQRVSLKAVSGPISTVSLHRPNGSLLLSRSTGIGTILLEPGTLAASGTHTVNVDPTGAGTGTVTLTLYEVPPDLTGPITPGGAPQTPALATPGQNARYTFSGTTGQRVSLSVSPGPLGTASILNPDGSALRSAPIGVVSSFIDTKTLGTTGTCTVLVDPSEANTGSVTVTLYDVPPDVTGPITPGGSPVTVPLTTPGQNGALTFGGTSGQRVSLKVNPSAPVGTVATLNPDGSTLASTTSGIVAAFIDTRTLGATGTYTVKVDPSGANTGNVTVTLYDVPPDVTGPITIGGSPVNVTITTPGQNGALTFNGTQGQQVTVRITTNTMGVVTVKLLKPDGSQLTATTSSLASFNLATQTLPVTGTYTIVIDPSQWNTGGLTVRVTSP